MGEERVRAERELLRLRAEMVERHLKGRDIRDPRVLAAMAAVPRHRFVPPPLAARAYDDSPLPIGLGQTISQPYIVALMTQALSLSGEEKVLEVGTGSGYQAAVLSGLCRAVHTVERHPSLAEKAASLLAELGMDNVTVHVGDGTEGWPAEAPFDAIVVTAAPPRVPPPLLGQLADGGRLVIPVGPAYCQSLELWRREGRETACTFLCPVSFVPLVGRYGAGE